MEELPNCSWGPATVPPLYTLGDLDKALENPDVDLRRWAAFTLGLRTWKYRADQESAWANPEPVAGVPPCVPSTWEVNVALEALDRVVPRGVYAEVQGCLLLLELQEPFFDGGREGGEAQGRSDWQRCCRLAERALENADPPLRQWFELGRAIGLWWLTWARVAGLEARADAYEPIAAAASRIPTEDRVRLETLAHLARMSKSFRPGNGLGLVQDLAASCPSLGRLQDFTVDDVSGITAITLRLHKLFDDYLLQFPRRITPQWDRQNGKLWYNGEVVRKVAVGKAECVVAVFDTFEAQGWPEVINYGEDTKRNVLAKKEVLKSINTDNLRVLRFVASGTRTGIRWKVASDPE